LSDENLVWCLKQKRGIRIIEPNPNLAKAYLKKAISALNTMSAAYKIKETDWILTTAYYARYFALYALLMEIGIKSEIHDWQFQDFRRHLDRRAQTREYSCLECQK
jgi:uncharacterized protein (UPF0332 family)